MPNTIAMDPVKRFVDLPREDVVELADWLLGLEARRRKEIAREMLRMEDEEVLQLCEMDDRERDGFFDDLLPEEPPLMTAEESRAVYEMVEKLRLLRDGLRKTA